ncbi:unnamed protein product [Chrysoparadoxa australica]
MFSSASRARGSSAILFGAAAAANLLKLASSDGEMDKEELATKLATIVGAGNMSRDLEDREHHGKPPNSYHHLETCPDVVVHPASTQEVSDIVKVCAQHRTPIIPYGGATSLEGQLLAPEGGVSIDFSNMAKVLRLSEVDHDVTVQPGLGYMELNEYLKQYNLWFPLDPGPGATLGGMCACRCSGSTAVRYGTMRENVVSATAVMANGEIVKTASRASKSSAGYDLTRLMVGSEGTLGVITELTLRVHKIPGHTAAMRASFNTIHEAAAAVQEVLGAGIQIGRAELMDDTMMKVINQANHKSYQEKTTLLFEFAGESPAAVKEVQDAVTSIVNKQKPASVEVTSEPDECKRMWKERKEALWAVEGQYHDMECMITDVCVPVSHLADLIATSKKQLDASWLPAPIVAHAGDGNFHTLIMFDPSKPGDKAEASRLSRYMVENALRLDGTCTGEHGVGTGKIKYLEAEHGKPALKVMASIKKGLDPYNILNPGKVLPQKKDPVTGKLVLCV